MAGQNVVEFTDQNFEQEVINSDQPVLVDFWAEWCMPCRMLAPTIDKIAKDYAGKVKVGKLDTDANRDVSIKYGISAIPTVILFKGAPPSSASTPIASSTQTASNAGTSSSTAAASTPASRSWTGSNKPNPWAPVRSSSTS